MAPDSLYAPAPRTHMTHPHGVRVFQMVDQMFAGIARAAGERGIRFHCVPDVSASGVPGRQRDTSIVYRQQFTSGLIQVPLLQCVIDLTYQNPERRAIEHPHHLLQGVGVANQLQQFSRTHHGSVYGGCGLQFNDLAKLFDTMVKTAGHYCMGQVVMWPLNIPGDDRDRDMAVVNLVLKDELDGESGYDYQLTLIWNGPDRFQRLLFKALNGQQA